MSSDKWRQWLKLTKKQLRQLGRTIDQELGNVLERHVPSQVGRLVRVPVPVGKAPTKFPIRNFIYRSFHQYTRFAQNVGKKPITKFNSSYRGDSNFISSNKPTSWFCSSARVPRGTPRGLFTNWNMTSTRHASQRMYSTASIKFTHDAVSNISVSLRCFLNSLDGFVPANHPNTTNHMNAKGSTNACDVQSRLTFRDISLLRDMEVFEMIKFHKSECANTGSETLGCYIEFKLPEFNVENAAPSLVLANSLTLDTIREEIQSYGDMLKTMEQSIRRIYDTYGSLPMTFAKDRVRIYFPNSTMKETELLVTELGIGVGCVYPDIEGVRKRDQYTDCENVLSNSGSTDDLISVAFTYSPILSESTFASDDYQII